MATLIGLLASTGLRSGEVVSLDRGDVDLTNRVVLVRKTKFRNDRLIPVHPTTRQPFVDTPMSATPCFPGPKARPSSSAREAAVCRRPACKATSLRPASSRVLTMASLCDRTISGCAAAPVRGDRAQAVVPTARRRPSAAALTHHLPRPRQL
ncbi:tyrosine-type recombinase/integrase [Bradyrhizobium ivorense]|uniref:tyrosine-type recombinase/integrase n=1 Tax=Bradyrhizobium ivorense TaxID=2511166 RepID=UPI001FCE3389|nr:tyrosine-type recombinase/integrase [Bradyrhizobium ivorense]